MTMQEALTARIARVRLPQWEASAYVELTLLPDGAHGPWARCHDVSGDVAVLITKLLADPESRYEPVPESTS